MDVYALEDLPIIVERDDVPLQASAVAAGHSHVAVVSTDSELLQWAKLALGPAPHLFEEDGRVLAKARLVRRRLQLVESTDGGCPSARAARGVWVMATRPASPTRRGGGFVGCSAAVVACGFRHAAALEGGRGAV